MQGLNVTFQEKYVSTINIQNSSCASFDSSNPKSYVWKTLAASYFWMLSECWILLNAIFNLNSALPFIWSIGCLNVFCQHSLFAINVGLCFWFTSHHFTKKLSKNCWKTEPDHYSRWHGRCWCCTSRTLQMKEIPQQATSIFLPPIHLFFFFF